jgi:ATP adenylyltransferase
MLQMLHSECTFCKNATEGSSADWNKVLAETPGYVVVPSKGALVPGWLLVISKRHYLCAGALPLGEFGALEDAIDIAKEMVTKHFGAATVFEHGPQRYGTSLGCGIDHLHMHVAPLGFKLTDAVESLLPETKWESLIQLSDLNRLHKFGLAYGLVQDHTGGAVWCRPQAGIRQMFRQAIANKIGTPEQFDYAIYPHLANVIHTIESLKLGA